MTKLESGEEEQEEEHTQAVITQEGAVGTCTGAVGKCIVAEPHQIVRILSPNYETSQMADEEFWRMKLDAKAAMLK